MSAPNGCLGRCCAAFYVAPEALTDDTLPDRETVRDMLIPLTNRRASERLGAVDSPVADMVRDADEGNLYTCKHHDADTLLCNIWADRPAMCRGYPYGYECEHGCSCRGEEGWEGA